MHFIPVQWESLFSLESEISLNPHMCIRKKIGIKLVQPSVGYTCWWRNQSSLHYKSRSEKEGKCEFKSSEWKMWSLTIYILKSALIILAWISFTMFCLIWDFISRSELTRCQRRYRAAAGPLFHLTTSRRPWHNRQQKRWIRKQWRGW